MVLLCCLALFDASQICNHVQSRVAAGFSLFPNVFMWLWSCAAGHVLVILYKLIHTHIYIYVHVHENCEGWLSPGGHSSGGRALTAKVRGPRFNPRWLLVFHSFLNISEPFHQVQVGLRDLCGLGSCGSQCIHDHMYMCLWSCAGRVLIMCWSSAGHVLVMCWSCAAGSPETGG